MNYSEGILGSGAAILDDGRPLPVEEIVQRLNQGLAVRQALENLLDVFERCDAGFPPSVELRFLAMDLAKTALKTPCDDPDHSSLTTQA